MKVCFLLRRNWLLNYKFSEALVLDKAASNVLCNIDRLRRKYLFTLTKTVPHILLDFLMIF